MKTRRVPQTIGYQTYLSQIGKKGRKKNTPKQQEASRKAGLKPCRPGKARGRPKKKPLVNIAPHVAVPADRIRVVDVCPACQVKFNRDPKVTEKLAAGNSLRWTCPRCKAINLLTPAQILG